MSGDVLERFSPATADWFRGAFAAPTEAQRGAWEAISSGRHTLVVAPTGSGKTLSAFLWALDRLATSDPPGGQRRRCRVLYVSPLKALAVDVERNLRSPLVGIGHAATRLGVPVPQVRVAVRSGDTPASDRRAFARAPADILITTPESLFLLLTSSAREALAGVETVIVDEVHAVAGTKRGAHLAVTLERLDALLERPAQRIGLSATVRPVDEVARFLAGGRPVDIVSPPSHKAWDLQVVVPVPDMSELGQPTADLSGPAAGEPPRASIWPHVEERIADLVAAHRSTLVFANSRRLAERLTARLNEIQAARLDMPADGEPAPPAQVMAQSGASHGAPAVLARAHHGSVSKEQRAIIEDDLKAGRLPAVVATSSLELGIDMGAVDLVVQVESPPSVSSGLQRVGRAGHQVGAVSRGVMFPKFRGDLVATAVVVERMRAGAIEALRVPANPLGRARPAGRRHVRARRLVGRRAGAAHPPGGAVQRPHPAGARGCSGHALGALPLRRVRRAAPARRLGPGRRHALGAARRAAAGRHLGRHHSRPRPVCRVPRLRRRARPAGRRAGRGDGVRVARRRRLHPGHVVVAHRGHHARPGARDAGTRPARTAAVLEGRHDRTSRRARHGRRGLRARGHDNGCGPRSLTSARRRPGRLGCRQPAGIPGRAAGGRATRPQRPDPAGRAVPRRARRLAGRRALALRRPRPRAVGARGVGPDARALRGRRAGHARRRRDRPAAAGHGAGRRRSPRPRRRAARAGPARPR